MENSVKFNLKNIFVENEKNYKFTKHQEPCIICEKPMNITEKTKWIHMTTSLEAVDRNYEGEDSQGCFPIGNDCCKKLPKYLVFQY
jgi:hypothetical protein